MKKILVLLILPFLLGSWQVTTPWQEKVDDELWQSALESGIVEFMVVLKVQADVSMAKELRTKEAKGQFVFDQLRNVAANTQPTIIQTIESKGAPYQSFSIVNAIWSMGDIALIEALARMEGVETIVSNPKIGFHEPIMEAPNSIGIRTLEWGITNINADDVWAMGYSGQNVVIGGQDTGYEWDHSALKEKYRGWDGSTADHNYNWHDAIHTNAGSNPCGTDSTVPCDDHNHGTHTMGTMVGDDGGANEIGVSPSSTWIGCRNMDNGNGTPATYIECFEWFLAPTDLNGANPDASKAPHVINNSWGCPTSEGCNTGNFSIMEMAVENLRSAGIVVVVSAGNSGSNCETVNSPAAIYEGSFTVGATNSNNDIAGFSSRGPVTVDGSSRMKPNVSAPGVGVRSAIRNNGYASFNGTSMAGPHVAGAVALVISANPNLAGDVETIETIIESTAITRTSTQTCGGVPGSNVPNNTYGFGKIDVLAAVNAAIAALPITILDFFGKTDDNYIYLYWNVEQAINFDHFELEKRVSQSAWQTISTIPSRNVLDHIQYSSRDKSPFHGPNYYRLKLLDIDGTYSYSHTIVIDFASAETISLRPNPVNDYALLQWQSATQENLLLDIYTTNGQLIETKTIKASETQHGYYLNTQTLSTGVYYLRIRSSQSTDVQQLKLMKL